METAHTSGQRLAAGITFAPLPRQRQKVKKGPFTCKRCEVVSESLEEKWEHAKTHIPVTKLLRCSKCLFVTEYKNNLQYHLLTHSGAKPFLCDLCEYACVSRSALASHVKYPFNELDFFNTLLFRSHTQAFPYKCQDCKYRTKYCHSLKIHVTKYGHHRAPQRQPMVCVVCEIKKIKIYYKNFLFLPTISNFICHLGCNAQ